MNSAQPALPYTPPAIKSEQELKNLCKTEAFEVSNPDGTDPCASIKKLTAQTASITIAQDKQQTPTEDKDNTYGVEGLALSGAIVLALMIRYRKKIARIIGKRRRNSIGYYSDGAVNNSSTPHNVISIESSKPKTDQLKEAYKNRQIIKKVLQDTITTGGDTKKQQDNLEVTFAFLSRDVDIDGFIIDEVRFILLNKVLSSNIDEGIVLHQRAIKTLQTLRLFAPDNKIDGKVAPALHSKLDKLLETIKIVEDYIKSFTPTQSPAAPVTPGTGSSEGTV